MLNERQDARQLFRDGTSSFDFVHDYFEGAAYSHHRVAEKIRGMATYIDSKNSLSDVPRIRWRELALELMELAEEIYSGSYSRLTSSYYGQRRLGGGQRYRLQAIDG